MVFYDAHWVWLSPQQMPSIAPTSVVCIAQDEKEVLLH
jgi:hypothetical protein